MLLLRSATSPARARILFHCSAVVAALWLAAPSAAAEPVRSLIEMRQENVILQRWDNSCAAAALATILTYQHGMPTTEKEVAEGMLRKTDALKVKHRGGFSLLDMKRYAQSRGFAADGYSGVYIDQLAELAPAIVPVKLRGYDHFVIVRQVIGDGVFIADSGFGNYKLSRADFTEQWNGNIGLVVTGPSAGPGLLRARASDLLAVPDQVVRQALRR